MCKRVSARLSVVGERGRVSEGSECKRGLGAPGQGGQSRVVASIRARSWSRWREGEVLYFDDSFEHEARNRCPSERVVFQVSTSNYGARERSLPSSI